MTGLLGQNELQEKLECMFAEVGAQMGDILRCIIEQEVSSHVARITQLNGILNGTVCDTNSIQQ